jgi:pSer/pThr/pTyr-binding forkhead associated (FHA) protein
MPPLRLVTPTGDQSFELPEGRSLIVGRGLTSDIAIYDPTISRRHAELTVGPEGVEVRDLDSSNGTCINGTRITSGQLSVNDTITFGKVLFRLVGATSPAPMLQRPAIAAEATKASWSRIGMLEAV